MPSEPLVLGFDTSAAHCAAALLCGDTLLVSRVEEMGRGQAERLMPLLEEVLAEAGYIWRDLDGIGVGVGPGNFTGIRISVSAARGLSLGLGVPAIGVSGFEALSLGLSLPCVAMIAAPRNQVYAQSFTKNAETSPVFCALDEVPEEKNALWVGAHAGECALRFGGQVAEPLFQPAEAVARVAQQRIHEPAGRPAPLYIKTADAAPPRDPAPVILS